MSSVRALLSSAKVFVLASALAYLVFLSLPLVKPIYAQTPATTSAKPATSSASLNGDISFGVANIMEIKDRDVKDGHIISSSELGPIKTIVPYDPQILGIVSSDAAIILSMSQAGTNGVPVVANGNAFVLVNTKNGDIKRGDLLTSSTTPGVAVKATKSGYMLGTAMADYSSSDPNKEGKIPVSLNLHYFNAKPTLAGTLTDIFKLALLPTKESPSPIFKYIVAALVVIASIILGFLSFGRAAAKGVEALGRNPMAGKIIHLGIIFNVVITVAIIAAGLVVAFLILRL